MTFTPASYGSQSAVLSITHDSAEGSTAIPLSGIGLAPAVQVSPATLGFGDRRVDETSTALSVTVTNIGNSPLTVSGVTVSDPTNFVELVNGCATVAASGSCTISVKFKPTSVGAKSATLSIVSDAAGSPHTVSLSGTGGVPAASVSPTSLTFVSTATLIETVAEDQWDQL
jgi:hypothetical protein